MQCYNPIHMNEGRPGEALTVPCGKCLACRISKAREWSMRLMHEFNYHKKAVFVTLTYNSEHLPKDNAISIDELQRFLKRLRKKLPPKAIKYYACGEYGEQFGRPHYHAIIFGLGLDDKKIFEEAWTKGNIKLGTVTYQSCRYVSDYVGKVDGEKAKELYGEKQLPFKLQSMGLGKQFALDNQKQIKQNGYLTVDGIKMSIPRYYITKLNIETVNPIGLKTRIAFYQKTQKLLKHNMEYYQEQKQKERNYKARLNIKNKGQF